MREHRHQISIDFILQSAPSDCKNIYMFTSRCKFNFLQLVWVGTLKRKHLSWVGYIFANFSPLLIMQFDVTFPAIPCSLLSIDAMDISGEQHLDIVCPARFGFMPLYSYVTLPILSVFPLVPFCCLVIYFSEQFFFIKSAETRYTEEKNWCEW